MYEDKWTKEVDRLKAEKDSLKIDYVLRGEELYETRKQRDKLRLDNENLARLADSFPQEIAKLEDEKAVLLDILKAAAARIELANAEGDNILSAWLPDARAAITQTERKEP